MLLTDRRRGFGMHDEDDERDALQGSLFAPESLAPPSRPARPPGPTPDPFAPPPAPREPEDAPPDLVPVAEDVSDTPTDPVAGLDAPSGLVPAADDELDARSGLVAPDVIAAPEYADVAGAVEVAPPAAAPRSGDVAPRRRAAPLSGPTLDDVMSRVWEGMRAEMPTPCPVCHTEVEPAMGGRCGSCGSALD